MARGITLVLGGARSGKSEVAERLAAQLAAQLTAQLTTGPENAHVLTYVATGPAPDAKDPEWQRRIELHRARRPATWSTVEVGPGDDLAATLVRTRGPVLVDSLGTWVSGRLGRDVDAGSDADAHADGDAHADADALCLALGARSDAGDPTVVVSEEVGLGVHPVSEAGRLFRDVLGEVNRKVAAVSERVLLVVAGRTLELVGAGPGADDLELGGDEDGER